MRYLAVKRRRLFILVAACATPLAARGDIPANRRESSERAALLALCAQLDCPRRFGQRCRDVLPPSERTRSSLAKTLIADARIAAGGHLSSGRLAEALLQRSRDDFRAGRLAMVEGWMLSLSEARLYALAAITASRHNDTG